MERERERRPGGLPLLVSRVECLGFHSLLVNLKCKGGDWGARREKQGHSGSQLSMSPKVPYKGNFKGGVAWHFT